MTETTTPPIPQAFTVLQGYLTTADLCEGFGRKELTIIVWRRDKGLPYVRIQGRGRDSIRYVETEVAQWAKKMGKKFRLPQRRVRLHEDGDGSTGSAPTTGTSRNPRSSSARSPTAREIRARTV